MEGMFPLPQLRTTAAGVPVDTLLEKAEHSADGVTLQGFPYNQMNHYVYKITACYQAYTQLYAG